MTKGSIPIIRDLNHRVIKNDLSSTSGSEITLAPISFLEKAYKLPFEGPFLSYIIEANKSAASSIVDG